MRQMAREVLDEYILQVAMNDMAIREERVRVLLQPRPRWLPERIWRRIVKRLLVIERAW